MHELLMIEIVLRFILIVESIIKEIWKKSLMVVYWQTEMKR
jgi:hypothetical protein